MFFSWIFNLYAIFVIVLIYQLELFQWVRWTSSDKNLFIYVSRWRKEDGEEQRKGRGGLKLSLQPLLFPSPSIFSALLPLLNRIAYTSTYPKHYSQYPEHSCLGIYILMTDNNNMQMWRGQTFSISFYSRYILSISQSPFIWSCLLIYFK